MPLDPRRVKGLFNAALDLPDPVQRPAFLDRECGGDHALRGRLDELLAAYDQPASALEQPLAVSTEEGAAADRTVTFQRETTASIVGSLVAGRYKIREEIGEGGMGSVYVAEQTQPVKRQVALKLIKAGMDSRTVLARFESERQALALMDHPSIAKILDAGTTDAGRPFFVMELVKGIPLTDYCDQHRFGLPERLSLFRQICSAVQHAHQKGIIHRDLKPRNILVESHDGHPVPKVIDFGLAKATSGLQLSEHSLYSAFGTVAGTPLYMAPEQASFNAIDIDTRADIYALGVILYELLTGSTPIPPDTFKKAALDEMLRMIREVEPPTPSSRISSSDTLPNIAANRHSEPVRLSRFVRGDLDWIVMKALSKERQRRYESAIAFAQDIERFTNHEPVSAGPPTAAYRFKKFVRRNRGRVIAASLVLLALVGGVIGTTLGLVEANRQRGIAVARRKEAEKRLGQKDKANEILLSIFRELNPRGEKETESLSYRLGKRLDLATAELEKEATDDPLGVARMQMALGESQLGLGYPEKAIVLFTKARATFTSRLGPDHADTLTSMNELAAGYQDAGQLDRALPLLEETLALRKKVGPNRHGIGSSMANLAAAYLYAGQLDRALPLLEEALALIKAQLGADHRDTLTSMGNLASGYQAAGQLDRALPLYEETLAIRKAKLGPAHYDTLTSMARLAEGYRAAGKLDRARALYEEALALSKSTLGPDHPDTLRNMHGLAAAYRVAGKLDRALPLYEEALTLQKAKLGPDHPDTLGSMADLAEGYRAAGKLDRALPLLEEALARQKSTLGSDHPHTLTSMNNLAVGYEAAGKLDQALPLLEEGLARRKSKLGPNHPATLRAMGNLAGGYEAAGELNRALRLFEETLALMKEKLGPDHPDTLLTMNSLGMAYWSAGILERSIPVFEETLKLRIARSGTDHADTWLARANLGINYRDAGRPGEAVPLLETVHRASREHTSLSWIGRELVEAYIKAGKSDKAAALSRILLAEGRAAAPAGSLQLAGLLAHTGLTLLDVKAWDEAEVILRESLAIREKAKPDDWATFNTKSMLGAALLGQNQTTEAEPLLRTGYEGLKKQTDKIPPRSRDRLGKALDRLIALAEATGQADEAKAWRAERANLPTATPRMKPGARK